MKIKEFLKKYKLTLKELAELLELSRPTLNSYINLYERGEEISNPHYQKIFQEIFSKEWQGKTEVVEEIKELKKSEVKVEDDYSFENLELINSIKEKMYSDMKGEKGVLPLYKFINSVLYNYNRDEGLTGYIDYNLFLNGLKKIEEISESEKILVSNIFPIMRGHIEKNLSFNSEGYELFIKRIEEIKKIREEETRRIEREFQEKIKRELELKFNIGKVIDEEKISEILEKIKF